MAIRNAARAIIIKDGKVLVNKSVVTIEGLFWNLPKGAICYDLPGGGQNQYESLAEAVVRECLEETGYVVQIERLAAVFEEMCMNDGFRAAYENYAHKIHFVFICHPTDAPWVEPSERDVDMVGSVWVDLHEVKDLALYPTVLRGHWDEMLTGDRPVYLGCERW